MFLEDATPKAFTDVSDTSDYTKDRHLHTETFQGCLCLASVCLFAYLNISIC